MADSLCILIKASGSQRRIAVLDEGKLAEYYEEGDTEDSMVNAIVLGRVERVLPAVQAAFVQIGQPLNGFLPLEEMDSYQQQEAAAKPLVSGAEIIVQIKKDPHEQKGAYLTRDISLPSASIVYMPLNRYVGVSKRITNAEEREALQQIGKTLCDGNCGVVMRESALHVRQETLMEEMDALRARWQGIQDKARFAKPPAVLYRDPSALDVLVRDYAPRYALGVTVNDAVNRMPSPASGMMWEQISDLEMDGRWTSSRIDEQVNEALSRHVSLKNGGTLVIDEREALSTIDVNTAKFVAPGEQALSLRQNLAACAEIARQIRLRNLSGILLIDFIDMHTEEQRARVMERLGAELSRERQKTVLHGFTSLGFLEMTRKRTGPTLREALEIPCDVCKGTGYRMERKKKQP